MEIRTKKAISSTDDNSFLYHHAGFVGFKIRSHRGLYSRLKLWNAGWSSFDLECFVDDIAYQRVGESASRDPEHAVAGISCDQI